MNDLLGLYLLSMTRSSATTGRGIPYKCVMQFRERPATTNKIHLILLKTAWLWSDPTSQIYHMRCLCSNLVINTRFFNAENNTFYFSLCLIISQKVDRLIGTTEGGWHTKSRDLNIKDYLANFEEIFANGLKDRKVSKNNRWLLKQKVRKRMLL